MNRRVPSERANRGKFRVELQTLGYVGLWAGSVPLDCVQSAGVSLFVVSVEEVAAEPAKALLATEPVMSGWPISTSAGVPLAVGIEFQISTRLLPRSVTKRRVPSEVTDTGSTMVAAVAAWLRS